MQKALIILASATIAVFLFIAFVVLFGPRLNIWAAERSNAHMRALAERVKADPPDKQALNELIDLLQSSDTFDGAGAAIALGMCGSHAEPAVDALAKALEGSNRAAAREAATSLGRIGPIARRAVPALIRAMRENPNADVGAFSSRSLGLIADVDDASVIEALHEREKHPDKWKRYDANVALRTLEYRKSNPTTQKIPTIFPSEDWKKDPVDMR